MTGFIGLRRIDKAFISVNINISEIIKLSEQNMKKLI